MQSYRVELTERFQREFRKLDKYTQKILRRWIEKNLDGTSHPRAHGKALTGGLEVQWRYRIGDYRLLCNIDDGKLVILALNLGHRREIYQS